MIAALLPLLLAGAPLAAAAGDDAESRPPWETQEGRVATRLDLARVLIEGGNAEAALTLLAQLRKEGVRDPRLDVLQGRALRLMGLTDDAREVLVAAVKRHPRDAEAHDQLGILDLDAHDLDAAIARFERARALDPDNPDYANNLGFALLAAGRAHEAVPPLREALRLDPTRARIRNNLGFALVADGHPDEAWRVFRAGGDEAGARYNLGLGLELAGDLDGARAQYARAVELRPGFAAAREALARLDPQAAPPPQPPTEDPP